MKKIFQIAIAVFCISPWALANSPVHISSQALNNLNWQKVEFSQSIKTSLSEQNQQALTEDFAGIQSPVAAYKIPANQGNLQIELTSPVQGETVFIPNVLVLDSQFNVAASYPASEFKFYQARGLKPNRMSAELNLTPSAGQDYIYLLVYTTKQDLAGQTIIPHPAKLYAKAHGNQPPAIDDIAIQHSKNGEIEINVTNSNNSRFIGSIFNSTTTQKEPPVVAKKSAVVTPVDKDTEAYFNQAVSKALKENNINKALNLVNEAEKLGLTTPRQLFLQKVATK